MKPASKTGQPQVTEITPALCDTLRAEINAALKSVGEAHGVTLALGNIKYTDVDATAQLKVKAVGPTSTPWTSR
jgi:hypothetical protein